MLSAEPKTFDLPEIRPVEARLILAVVLSLALHLALLFLVQVRPAPRPEPPRVLQVAQARAVIDCEYQVAGGGGAHCARLVFQQGEMQSADGLATRNADYDRAVPTGAA